MKKTASIGFIQPYLPYSEHLSFLRNHNNTISLLRPQKITQWLVKIYSNMFARFGPFRQQKTRNKNKAVENGGNTKSLQKKLVWTPDFPGRQIQEKPKNSTLVPWVQHGSTFPKVKAVPLDQATARITLKIPMVTSLLHQTLTELQQSEQTNKQKWTNTNEQT